MFKYLLVGLVYFITSFGAIAGNTPEKSSGWANVDEFCVNIDVLNAPECKALILQYQDATNTHFKSLSAQILRRIGNKISDLADKGSKHSKSLKEAVDDIGDALRKPIEIPTGVRSMPNASAQQYIQQQIPPTLSQ